MRGSGHLNCNVYYNTAANYKSAKVQLGTALLVFLMQLCMQGTGHLNGTVRYRPSRIPDAALYARKWCHLNYSSLKPVCFVPH